LTCRKSWYSLIRGRKSLIYSSDPADSGSCRRPSKGVEGVLYGGKLFMKKKLVSILLSLSMCTAYAMPLTAVAEAPAEEPTVVETEAPNANTKEFKFVQTSTGAKLEVQYGDSISLDGKGAWAVGGTSAGGVNVTGFSEKVLVDSQANVNKFTKVEYSLDSKSAKFAEIDSNNNLIANGVNKTATVNVTVTTGGELEATGTLSVSLKPKDITNVANGVVSGALIKKLGPHLTSNYKASDLATVDFETELGSGKKYASLDDVVKKFKGKKGVSFKIRNIADDMFTTGNPGQISSQLGKDVELKANQDYTVTAEIGLVGDTNKKYNNYTVNEPVEVGGKKYNCYVKTGSAASGGYAEKNSVTNKYPVQDDVTIIIQGKKNYTGTFVVTGCKVKNLETQRIYAKTGTGLLAGSTVKFGEAEDILSGIYFDNDTTAQDPAVLKDAVKLKAVTKNIKIDGKTNKVTVKSVANTAKDNVAKISVTSKKNKNAATEIEFTVTAKSISTQGFDFTDTKAVGTTEKKKYYKTLAEFEKKFGANGKGLDLSWKDNSSGKEKVVKLKAGKDYKIAVTKAGIQILDKNGKGTGVYTNKAKDDISSELIYTVTGSGNYKGSVTGSIVVPLEPQLITGAAVASGKSVTFGSVEANIFDYVFVDKEGLKTTGRTGIKGNADVIKNFKVKGDKNVKIDKEGNITVKTVDKNGTKITVTSKKNKAAECEYKFKLAEANLSKINPSFDDAAFSGKTYADASKAQDALKKIKVTVGEKTKLKADKDYTVKLANGSTAADKKSYTADVVITGKSGSNYTGTATKAGITVNLKVKESK
jgi:hypothetical protein